MISDLLPRLASTVFSNIISSGEPDGVYLTFDDGPDPIFTPRLLDLLAEHSCPASFFVMGGHSVEHSDIVKRIIDEGHSIGCHGYDHRSTLFAGRSRILTDLSRSVRTISGIIGYSPQMYRPPYGRFGPSTLSVAGELRMRIILWSLSSGDYRLVSSERIVNNIVRRVKPGDFILLHDRGINVENMLTALPIVLEELSKKGLIPLSLKNLPAV
ncbi:polysaccharide deacetylase family protein [bacterium]|nr:polysaccharide deacetylase family protein [bacterium]